MVRPEQVEFMDVSPNQLVSVAAAATSDRVGFWPMISGLFGVSLEDPVIYPADGLARRQGGELQRYGCRRGVR
mgnify:CR=1 FL=1